MEKRIAFHPGEYLTDELQARHWSQTDLAKVLDRPLQHANLLVNNKRRITVTVASELASAFGTSAEMWLNLQAAWDTFNAPPL